MMILNSTYDRETFGMPASAFVASITDALNRTFCDSMESRNCDDPCPSLDHSVSCDQAYCAFRISNIHSRA